MKIPTKTPPYAISCDWLQLYLTRPNNLTPDTEEINGYHFVDCGYGSKIFKNIFKVIEPTGELLGTIAFNPYSSVIKPLVTIFKIENRVLYQSDYMARVFEFIAACNFTYKGITRIDLCYDCNQYINGLLPENLIKRYLDNKYLKIGLNNYAVHGNATYKINTRKPSHPSQDDIQEHSFSGILFGSRKSDIQVNIYDKTKELKEQTMKHYIVDYWKMCGIDPEKKVWRTEIRIQSGGKSLKNMQSGHLFNLSINDLVTQETIEQMFHVYAAKYCRFVIRDYHTKAQQMNELRLFSYDNVIRLRPKRLTTSKDYTRMQKIMINNLDKHIAENAREDNEFTEYLEEVRDYYLASYRLEKWHEEKNHKAQHEKAIEELETKRDKQKGDTNQYLSLIHI